MSAIRIAVIADIHHGRDTSTKKGTAALPLLERFLAFAEQHDVDAVIELGDRISDVSADEDRALQREIAARFHALRLPRHHVSGNHDHALLSLAENSEILEAPLETRAVLLGDLRIVFWQPDVRLTHARGFHLARGDLDDLVRVMGEDERPTLLVSHVPLSGHAQTGNYYFERNPGHATYAEIEVIRATLAEAPCPLVALAGHVHWNSLTVVDGTPHLTLQSLTETFTTGEAAGSYGVLEIEGERLQWTVSGRDPFAVTLPWRATKPRWVAPLPQFSSEMWSEVRRAG